MSEEQGEIWIAVLGSGWHVIYESGRDENGDPIWKYPLFLEIEEQDDGQPGLSSGRCASLAITPLWFPSNPGTLCIPIDRQRISSACGRNLWTDTKLSWNP